MMRKSYGVPENVDTNCIFCDICLLRRQMWRRMDSVPKLLAGPIQEMVENWRLFASDLHFNIVTPLTPTYYPNNVNHRPNILDIALMKGVALKFSCIEPLQWLNSDHRPVLMRLGSLIGDCPPSTKTITNRQKVSTALEEIDTPILTLER
ncbi:hypothetical protein EVAR_96351_1 [Eumeta japonica]|uniref:RNA-directed DNA polymerase from mobile element jockey n=1 Tax=Eumeta variegata TaxID=151549 RepID=A0A4C1VXW0_EUMVA|nr:hypothetical protein EVAR_96351_1 [Eumeta japonica]